MNKIGKGIGNIIKIKKEFFEQNEKSLSEMDKIADVLMEQPQRQLCKICKTKLPYSKLFTSHRIGYFLCENCGHLNSEFEDTNDFSKKIYI